jgi:Transcription factor WhiB
VSAQLDAILDAFAAGPDLHRGLCAWQWDLFDSTDDPLAVERAVELCRQCPVLTQCAEWSAAYSPHDLSGVVAGQVRPWSPQRKPKAS